MPSKIGSRLAYILPFLAIFVFANLDGLSWNVGLAVFDLCVIVTVVLGSTLGGQADESSIVLLPAGIYCIGVLIFHAGWGGPQRAQSSYVAESLLLVSGSILMVYLGARLGSARRETNAFQEQSLDEMNHNLLFSVSLILIFAGWVVRFWALKTGLMGFSVAAFGVDYSDRGGLVATILALRELAGVGQIMLLLLLLKASRSLTSLQRFAFFSLLLLSFSLDLVFSFQSAAKGEILGTFVPFVVTFYAFGNRRVLFALLVIGLLISTVLVFPLANDLRYDSEYYDHLQRGELFLPSFDDVMQALSFDLESLRQVRGRFNQTSLLAFSIQRRGEGLASLAGRSYWYAFKTLVPRALFPQRVDQKISYDFYTGYVSVFSGYNNWGLHTEAYLNFGIMGILVLMPFVGFVWQRAYQWLLSIHPVTGWAIAASILLSSILRAGEYGFLASIVSVSKSLVFVTLVTKAAMEVVRLLLKMPDSTDIRGA